MRVSQPLYLLALVFLFRLLFISVCIYEGMFHVQCACRRQERVSNPLEVDVQAVVSYLTWMLETMSAENTLNC